MMWNILYIALALPVVWLGPQGDTTDGDAMVEQRNLIDFSTAEPGRWRAINDGVMGGVSQGGMRRTDRGTGVFEGVLSLEHNGGFASVRAVVDNGDLTRYAGLEVRVRGDGRIYQLRLRTDDSFDGVAYRASFETRDGEWTTTRIPFDQFLPGFRGRTLSDAVPLDTSQIRQLAFMLSDKKPGPFSLEIDFVRVWKSAEVDS